MLRCFNGRHCRALGKAQLSRAPGPERPYLLTKPDMQLPLHMYLTRCLKSQRGQIYNALSTKRAALQRPPLRKHTVYIISAALIRALYRPSGHSAARYLRDVNHQDNGAGKWTRTTDLLITNEMLYHLSYSGIFWRAGSIGAAGRAGNDATGSLGAPKVSCLANRFTVCPLSTNLKTQTLLRTRTMTSMSCASVPAGKSGN